MSKADCKKWYDYVAQRVCMTCAGWPVEVAHIKLLISDKTGLALARRDGLNQWAVIPLCDKCHREGPESIHKIGEDAFFEKHHIDRESLLRVWASWFVAWVEQN